MKALMYLTHGFVFAAGSGIILYGAVDNLDDLIHPADVLLPTIFAIIAFILFTLIAYLLTRSLDSAGLIASLLVLGFFHLWSVFLAVLVIALTTLLSIRLLLKRVRYADTHMVLNTISVAIVGYYLFRFISLNVGELGAPTPVTIHPVGDLPSTSPTLAGAPDIYYIILDGYGRADMLQTIHGFDNSMFVDALEQRGFVVPAESQSNYSRTTLSLLSSLNMQYLDARPVEDDASRSWWPMKDAVQHSEVRRILENQGYKTIFFANNADFSDTRDGDFYEAPFPIQFDIFSSLFLYQTNIGLLAGIDQLGISQFSYDTHRRIILYAFERLPEVAALEGPKYVFAHIIAPHPPYVFGRMGNPVDPSYPFSLSVESHTGYIEQIQFINQATLEMIDGILANSKSPPVIIIQADHGPGTLIDPNSVENTCLYERFSILNAYHLPGVEPASVPIDLSPVNTFRFIFNTYFKGQFELLPNRQYFTISSQFYEFTDVTGQTGGPCH
jgi:hypothetical protein